eukprot:scaffold115278_cov42-Cyclotella_meneghiniana.AAC.5
MEPPNSILAIRNATPCIYDMAIIAIGGHGVIISKCPPIARYVLSGQGVLLYCSPHNHKVHVRP